MIILENVDTKEELIKEFYTWLFDDKLIVDKSVELQKELDISLVQSHSDPYIYYPKQIANFFNTSPMKRLSRISQLGLANNIYPNTYHSRLEHSKGVYNRKLEEFLYNFQNENWRNTIEKKNQKIYLLADLIKMAGHDIGHLPLSHLMEIELFSYRGAHEDLGKRIMLENPEIQFILKQISPILPEILNKLYENNIMNFKEHDESNYDVDRLDYVCRDYFYIGTPINLPHTNYKTVQVQLDYDGKPKVSNLKDILTSTSSGSFIDVYDKNSLNIIETLLEKRLYGYETIYTSSLVAAHEKIINAFFESFIKNKNYKNYNLGIALDNFKNKNIPDVNLNDLLKLDDITLYSEILDIAESYPDANIRALATMAIPYMESFLNLIYSHLQIKNKNTENLSVNDIDFLKKIKKLIKSDTELANALKDKNYRNKNILFFDNRIYNYIESLPEDIQKRLNGLLINHTIHKKAYNINEPIYIYDSIGKMYELSNHPDRKYDWTNRSIDLQSCFTYIPYLKFHNIPDDIIMELSNYKLEPALFNENNYSPQYNMQPLRVGHSYEQYFSHLNVDDQR